MLNRKYTEALELQARAKIRLAAAEEKLAAVLIEVLGQMEPSGAPNVPPIIPSPSQRQQPTK